MIIVITGNPGVGKHTIANEISKKLNIPLLDINEIARNSGLFESNENTNDVDVEKLENIISQKISNPCLIVGHLAPYVLESEKIDKVIVLRKNPYDLIKVYEKRGYSKEKSRENTGSEILGIIAFDAIERFGDKVFQINVTDKTIKEVSNTVQRVLENKHASESVDWLEIVTAKKDLEKFFAY